MDRRTFVRSAGARDVPPYALQIEFTREDEDRSGMVGFGMSEENTALFLAHPVVAHRATFARPHQYRVGVEHVLVNGGVAGRGSRPDR
jgi:hypothetical protein